MQDWYRLVFNDNGLINSFAKNDISILESQECIIFINDMFMHASSVDDSSLYADDSSFYTVGNSL